MRRGKVSLIDQRARSSPVKPLLTASIGLLKLACTWIYRAVMTSTQNLSICDPKASVLQQVVSLMKRWKTDKLSFICCIMLTITARKRKTHIMPISERITDFVSHVHMYGYRTGNIELVHHQVLTAKCLPGRPQQPQHKSIA